MKRAGPLKRVAEMIAASDPVHGTAASFDAEREARKHIGNYALCSLPACIRAASRRIFST